MLRNLTETFELVNVLYEFECALEKAAQIGAPFEIQIKFRNLENERLACTRTASYVGDRSSICFT